jgi:enoyl-CoA hydratase
LKWRNEGEIMSARLMVSSNGPIATIVFSNLARHNAVTYEMWSELPARLTEINANSTVRAVVLTGDGEKAFVSGADISEFEKKRGGGDAAAVYNRAVDAAYVAVQACQKPTVARIRGICMGGGLWLALACDLRICNDAARFAMPAVRIGLGIRYESVQRMLDVLPALHAADLLLTGRQFGGQEALRIGLVNRSVSDDELDSAVAEYTDALARNSPLSMLALKEAMRVAQAGAPADGVARVRGMVDACFSSEDYKEGRRAFAEKRTPAFTGR